jgi:hypothetical protein
MVAGAAIGGGLSLFGSMNAADKYSSAADKAAQASKFTPYNVYSGFGSGTFDPGSPGTPGRPGYRTGGESSISTGGVWHPGTAGTPATAASATASLNPQYQALRDQFMGQANSQLGAFGNYNPDQASADIYGKLASLSAPDEARARSDMESRLLAQGMLGSSGGGIQQQALFDSQGKARTARELQAYTTAQDTLDRMQGRAINATNAASGLDSLALQNLNLGGAFGGKSMQGNQFGANIQYGAAANNADASAQFWAGLGQQVGPAIGSMFNGNGYNNSGFNASQYYNGNAMNSGPNAYSSGGGFGQGAFNYSGQG